MPKRRQIDIKTEVMWEALVKAAEKSGRSVTQEANYRLAMSFS